MPPLAAMGAPALISLIGGITGAAAGGVGVVKGIKDMKRSDRQQGQMDDLLYGPGGVLEGQGELLDAQTGSLKSGIETAEGLKDPAADFLSTSSESFGPAIDFWSKLLSGDEGIMTSLLDPEISRISEGYQAAADETARGMPRGGARSAAMVQLPYKRAGDISSLFANLRPQAANALTDIGSRTGAIGSNLFGNILNALVGGASGASWTSRNLMDFGLGAANADLREGQVLGSAVDNLLGTSVPNLIDLVGGGGKSGGASGGGNQTDQEYWDALSP